LINVVTNRFTHGIVLFISDRALKEMEDLGSSLRDKLADKDRVIASLKATLATMTEDKDRMLDGRDVDAVKAEQLIRKCNALDQQVAQYKASYAALESNLQEAHANLVTTQNNCAALEKRIAAMREENLDVIFNRVNQYCHYYFLVDGLLSAERNLKFLSLHLQSTLLLDAGRVSVVADNSQNDTTLQLLVYNVQ
jgi:hypothetical protein